ncbi:MAG: hypothetical protein II198_06165 [Bacteroidaceae bacterium]|nr:hypothetical protein [Bacteroidaceae bacterium]
MNPKQEILQILFDSNVFTGNFSELARRLGYTKNSRTTIERVKTGERELTQKTIDALCEKIYELYLIDESEMATIANSVAYGKELYHQLREAYGTSSDWHNTALCAVVTEDYPSLPAFDKELAYGLKEMKLQEPDIYYGMLSYFYILCNDIFPYTAKGRKALSKQLCELNEILHNSYPGSNRSYEAAKKSIEMNLADEGLTILKLIYSFRVIIRGYADDDYFENFLREKGHLLDVGDDSFWTVPDETFKEGCELWYLSVIPTKSHCRGAYTAMRLRAKSNSTESFELIGAYNFMFIIDEAYDNLHLLQAYDLPTGKTEYAQFRYNGDKRLLELNFDDMPEKTFNLPAELVCINHTSPQGKEEKIWAVIIERMLKSQCQKLILQAVNSSSSSNIEYLTDREVTNVCIDRKSITVTIDDGESEREYIIDADAYPFFARLTANEFASIVRYKDTGEAAIAWNNLGQYIPLKEFRKK